VGVPGKLDSKNVCLVSTSFRNWHTSELKANLLGGFAKFRAEMHSLVKAAAQIWAEKAGNSSALKHFRHMYTNDCFDKELNENYSIVSEFRACVRNLDLWVQSVLKSYGPQNLQVSIVPKASKSAGAKGDVPKIYGFVHPLHHC